MTVLRNKIQRLYNRNPFKKCYIKIYTPFKKRILIMSDAISAMNSQMASQTASMQMAAKALCAQKQQAAIAMQLLQGAMAVAPQDPSTITAAQLQSPIDIRV